MLFKAQLRVGCHSKGLLLNGPVIYPGWSSSGDFFSIALNQTASTKPAAIQCGIVLVCQRLSIDIVADGIETSAESAYLRSLGVRYPQGYLFAKPGWESLPLAPRHA